VHGTTAGTNALLERKGARIGVITTAGLRDVLEMRRRDRPRTWGLRGDFRPVVPRDLRLEVPERTLADGTIHTPVDLDAVRAAAQTFSTRAARRSRSFSPMPMPTRRTRPARSRRCARSGPIRM
jgi:N-methylhydantoinase A/oxoprolinase/acetone carboxylase beta subunit